MKLFKNLMAQLGIAVPDKASYKPIWHIPYKGADAASIAAGYEFFANSKTDDTGNYASDKKLVKKGAVTIFGIQLVCNAYNGTFAELKSFYHELLAYGRLELRKDTTRIDSIPSIMIPGGNQIQGSAAVTTTATTTTLNYGHLQNGRGGVDDFFPVVGGIKVEEEDQFNIVQRFSDTGAEAVIQALTSLEIQYGIILHTAVHDPQENVLGDCVNFETVAQGLPTLMTG